MSLNKLTSLTPRKEWMNLNANEINSRTASFDTLTSFTQNIVNLNATNVISNTVRSVEYETDVSVPPGRVLTTGNVPGKIVFKQPSLGQLHSTLLATDTVPFVPVMSFFYDYGAITAVPGSHISTTETGIYDVCFSGNFYNTGATSTFSLQFRVDGILQSYEINFTCPTGQKVPVCLKFMSYLEPLKAFDFIVSGPAVNLGYENCTFDLKQVLLL